jgi:hypothetical protein
LWTRWVTSTWRKKARGGEKAEYLLDADEIPNLLSARRCLFDYLWLFNKSIGRRVSSAHATDIIDGINETKRVAQKSDQAFERVKTAVNGTVRKRGKSPKDCMIESGIWS